MRLLKKGHTRGRAVAEKCTSSFRGRNDAGSPCRYAELRCFEFCRGWQNMKPKSKGLCGNCKMLFMFWGQKRKNENGQGVHPAPQTSHEVEKVTAMVERPPALGRWAKRLKPFSQGRGNKGKLPPPFTLLCVFVYTYTKQP